MKTDILQQYVSARRRPAAFWASPSNAIQAVNLLNPSYLFASLLWGSIGIGYCIYGRRQKSVVPLAGGVSMIAVSYLADSVLVMSLVCLGLMALVYVVVKRGY